MFLRWLWLCLLFHTTYAGSQFLTVDQAFKIEPRSLDSQTLVIHFKIHPKHYLYRDSIQIGNPFNPLFKRPVANKIIPDPEDPRKQIAAYAKSFDLSFTRQGPFQSTTTLRYQGCAAAGICYPPQTKILHLDWQTGLASLQPLSTTATSYSIHSNIFINAITFLMIGLLLALTPCVLPMIPILSGLITSHRNISTRQALSLTLCYILAMALTYALIGWFFASAGNYLQAYFQAPWVLIIASLFLVLLALSLFDVFMFQLPASWRNQFDSLQHRIKGGSYLGAAIMGFMATLVVSPCATPPLIAALGYIAQTGQAFMGSFSLFFLGLGMGLPLLLVGFSAGKWLPRCGSWMNVVKACFGITLLVMAISLLDRIIPPHLTLGLIGCLLIGCGVYLGAFRQALTGWAHCWQSLAIICCSLGLLYLVGAAMGNQQILKPLAGQQTTPQAATSQQSTATTPSQFRQYMQQAHGKPILVKVFADWCVSCKIIDRTVLSTPQVQQALENFVIIKADVSDIKTGPTLLSYLNTPAPPALIIYKRDGQASYRFIGQVKQQQLLTQLAKVR